MSDSVQSRILVDSGGFTLYTWFHGARSYGSPHNDPQFLPLTAHGRVVAARGSKIEQATNGRYAFPTY